MGYTGVITHLLTIDPNFQRDIQAPPGVNFTVSSSRSLPRSPASPRRELRRHHILPSQNGDEGRPRSMDRKETWRFPIGISFSRGCIFRGELLVSGRVDHFSWESKEPSGFAMPWVITTCCFPSLENWVETRKITKGLKPKPGNLLGWEFYPW